METPTRTRREMPATMAVDSVVAHDVRGAIDGAVTGAEIAGIGSSLNVRVRLAVAGAIAGGGSGSIIGYFDAQERAVNCAPRPEEVHLPVSSDIMA